jgi:hypothetical protein
MHIDTEFQVNAPAEKVWDYLLRVEEVATCVPGAEILDKVSDDEFTGRVTVKVGPLGLNLQGTALIESRDGLNHVLTISGKGKDQQGRGSADATVVVRVLDAGAGATRVQIDQDIRVTGRIAQFGRGVMKDLSQRLAQDFARCLEGKIARDAEAVTGTAAGAGAVEAAVTATPSPATTAKPLSGFRLLTWAVAGAVGRLFRRVVGRESATD